MHVESRSCAVSAYEACGPAARTQAKRERAESRQENPAPAETPRAELRRNPLVSAMMEALKSLVPAQSASGTTTPSESGAPTTTTGAMASASTDTATLKEAALAFAHALYGALSGAGDDSRGGEGRPHKHGHGHGHFDRAYGRSGRGGGNYDDLPAQLEALAQQIVGKPAASAAGSTVAARASTAAPTITTASTASSSAATTSAATVSNPSPTAAVADAALVSTVAAPIKAASIQVAPPKSLLAANTGENPLVTAFRQLFEALNAKPVKADTGGEPAPAPKVAASANGAMVNAHERQQALRRTARPWSATPPRRPPWPPHRRAPRPRPRPRRRATPPVLPRARPQRRQSRHLQHRRRKPAMPPPPPPRRRPVATRRPARRWPKRPRPTTPSRPPRPPRISRRSSRPSCGCWRRRCRAARGEGGGAEAVPASGSLINVAA